jgi:hypothetical protein
MIGCSQQLITANGWQEKPRFYFDKSNTYNGSLREQAGKNRPAF